MDKISVKIIDRSTPKDTHVQALLKEHQHNFNFIMLICDAGFYFCMEFSRKLIYPNRNYITH